MRNKNFLFTLSAYLIFVFLCGNTSFAQVTIFSDDFESGLTNWTLSGTFGLSNTDFYSTTNSLTDSPVGNYSDMTTITATITNSIDLSSYLGADISFYAKYSIENAFDYMYLEISKDGGSTFQVINEFTGTNTNWVQYNFDIGAFAGYSNVVIRFRLTSDQYVNKDGMYIDDLVITGTSTDNSSPLIVSQEPEFYEGVQSDYSVFSTITDVSGISSTVLYYYVDGLGPYVSNSTYLGSDQYQFIIPAQSVGTYVKYKIEAVDNSPNLNKTDTATVSFNKYISGTYLKYDDGIVAAVKTISGSQKVATKISIPQNYSAKLTTILIRNYRDGNHVNDQMEIHVWDDNNGQPGNDLLTPILANAEATLDNPFPFTRIDLRNYSSQLSGLTGDFFIGFTVPQNSVSIITSDNSNNRSYFFDGTNWTLSLKDYEFRAIVEMTSSSLPVELTTFYASNSDDNVLLNWETATEVNNYGFEIFRSSQDDSHSEEGTDEDSWEKIAFVQGYGNSNSPKHYEYEDNNVRSGKYFYRLKQIDIDGKFTYSDEVEVYVEVPNNIELIQNYPNPFNPSTTISFTIKEYGNVKIKVFDTLGREVASLLDEAKNPGKYKINFDGSNLASGIYFYSMTAGGITSTKKMLLNK